MISAQLIKRIAREESFDLVGISKISRLDPEAERLGEWIRRGYDADMDWIKRSYEKRVDPGRILENAKTIISFGKNYYTPFSISGGSLKISRYAWGDDYHIILNRKLKNVVVKLKEQCKEGNFVYYCDTGPVMEKAWANRAGLGWVGKNTNLINQEIGSWFFLSEIITDVECDEYDVQAMDHCGTCRKCLDACPTNALVEPYVLDSNKCISFLTIENKKSYIEPNIAGRLEGWIFGCDICQEVCPWNQKFQKPTEESEFYPRKGNLNLKAEDVHQMSLEEFNARFWKSPVKRAKLTGLKRNITASSNEVYREY
ncbi:MAG: tRNA epoxyqueuosine(34) reductase QueG [Candidatus Kryptoniota bacterium]